MVNPMQYGGRMPMPYRMSPRMPYGGYGGYGQNRNNNMLRAMLFSRMMNNNMANQYAGGHQEGQVMQQQYMQYPSYGGGGHHQHRSSAPRGYGYPSRRAMSKAVPKKPAKKKEDDDNDNEEVVSTSTSNGNGYAGIMDAMTGKLPEGRIFSDMNKISLNEQQFRTFIAENAINVVKRYVTETYGDEDGYLLLDDDEDETNDDMVTPQDNKDIYTIDVFNIDADEGVDDMRYAAAYESFDEALEAARECARSYADCGEVICVSIMSGEFETPSGDTFGDPEAIYTISNSDEETTMNARKEAGFATAEVDEYTE